MDISNSNQESIFYHFLLSNQIYLATTKPEFFTNPTLRELFEIAKDHAVRYKEAPSLEQLSTLVNIKGRSERLNEGILNAVYNIKREVEQYDKEWLEQNVGSWIQIRNLDASMRKAIAFVKTSKITVDNSSEIVEKVRHMLTTETTIDFTFSRGSDFFNAASHSQAKLERTPSGFDYLDLCLKGGYWKGSFIVFAAGAKAGKSMVLGNLAARSVQLGFNTAYVTLELQESLVAMRIGANLLDIPIDTYEEVSKDQDFIKKRINDLQKNTLGKLGVLDIKEFPTSTASVNDIANYLKKMEEQLGISFNNVFIDYVNIMKNWRNPNTENTYMKIKQICEDLSAMAKTNHWAVISVTQVRRDDISGSDMTATSISESIGLLHTVDMLFGIITNPEMKAKGEYYLKCLASRVSAYENTKKRFTINWKHMRLEEDMMSQIVDCEAFINNVISAPSASRQFNNNKRPTPQNIASATVGSIHPGTGMSPNNSFITETIVTGDGLF